MSETPRTDSVRIGPEHRFKYWEDFARQLEREVAEARAEIMRLSAAKLTAEDGLQHVTALKNQIHLSYQSDLAAANTVIARKDEALREIESMQAETPPSAFPADWSEQIAACPRRRDLKSHPIMGGICDDHRQPFYHDEKRREGAERMVPSRMRTAARAALSLTPATVRDEVEAMRKQLADAINKADEWSDGLAEQATRLDALRTRVEKAEADVARLDWLQANVPARGEEDPMQISGNHWHVKFTGQTTTDLRAAIDAARQPTPQPHEEGKR